MYILYSSLYRLLYIYLRLARGYLQCMYSRFDNLHFSRESIGDGNFLTWVLEAHGSRVVYDLRYMYDMKINKIRGLSCIIMKKTCLYCFFAIDRTRPFQNNEDSLHNEITSTFLCFF